jgi:catabolite regulation protein CreA
MQILLAGAAWAGRDKVGEFQASGFLFKDTVEVNALDDPEGGQLHYEQSGLMSYSVSQ